MPYGVERGQIWQLGRHRLMCGDATSRKDVEKLLDGHVATLVLTDPPYGVNIVRPAGGGYSELAGYISGNSSGKAKWRAAGLEKLNTREGSSPSDLPTDKTPGTVGAPGAAPPRLYDPVIGDDSTDSAKAHWEIVKDVSDNQVIFGGNYFTDFLPIHKRWLVWDKLNGQNNNFADGELAWTSFDKPLRIYQWRWSGMIRKGPRNEELKERIHPTQKPVGLLRAIIEDHTSDGDSILDCFLGSGSTLIAAETCGRTCYGMELSEGYCEKILQRYEDFTGDKPVLIA